VLRSCGCQVGGVRARGSLVGQFVKLSRSRSVLSGSSPRRHDAAVLTGVLQYRKFRLAVRYESNGTWSIHAGPLCHTGQLVPSVSNSPLGKSPKSFRSPCCRLCKVFEVNKSREVSEVIRTCEHQGVWNFISFVYKGIHIFLILARYFLLKVH
jgi:hypothetical protein